MIKQISIDYFLAKHTLAFKLPNYISDKSIVESN